MVYLVSCALFGSPVVVLTWAICKYFSADPDRKQQAGLGFLTVGLLAGLLAVATLVALSASGSAGR